MIQRSVIVFIRPDSRQMLTYLKKLKLSVLRVLTLNNLYLFLVDWGMPTATFTVFMVSIFYLGATHPNDAAALEMWGSIAYGSAIAHWAVWGIIGGRIVLRHLR